MGWPKTLVAVGLLMGIAAVAWEWKSSVNIEGLKVHNMLNKLLQHEQNSTRARELF